MDIPTPMGDVVGLLTQGFARLGLGERRGSSGGEDGLVAVDQSSRPGIGRESDRGHDHLGPGLLPRDPMAGLVLDTDEVVVGKTVGTGVVFRFNRSLPVPHHQVEDGDHAIQGGKNCYKHQCRKTLVRGFPFHQHPMVNVPSDLVSRVSYVKIEG